MAQSFFFYDLETSGFNPRSARIMQFAGQRTDLRLKPIGQPVNTLIKMTRDVLPDPEAVLITGITPQMTMSGGQSEADFLTHFEKEISVASTIFVGFNNIRFDDEFVRFLHYRNLYDAYQWQWHNDCSRWDLLDVIRMCRALRPEGINWPSDVDGRSSNRLELLTSANQLTHTKAHDAMSDVEATIALARLLFEKQPKLFSFLLTHRDKKSVSELVMAGNPFVYTSGKYPSEFEKTTIVEVLAPHPDRHGALVYDLRQDPSTFIELSPAQLAEAWRYDPDPTSLRLPVKTLQFNRCPAVAPIEVLTPPDYGRLQLDKDVIRDHQKRLHAQKDFAPRVLKALQILDKSRDRQFAVESPPPVDARLYDGFFDNYDKRLMQTIHDTPDSQLGAVKPRFHDQRLSELLPLYVSRNFFADASPEQRRAWQNYRRVSLGLGDRQGPWADYRAHIEELTVMKGPNKNRQELLSALQQWGEELARDVLTT